STGLTGSLAASNCGDRRAGYAPSMYGCGCTYERGWVWPWPCECRCGEMSGVRLYSRDMERERWGRLALGSVPAPGPGAPSPPPTGPNHGDGALPSAGTNRGDGVAPSSPTRKNCGSETACFGAWPRACGIP